MFRRELLKQNNHNKEILITIVNLKNVSSIVTGGASGLGAATAAALAAAGSRVAILDVNDMLAKKTADAIGALAISLRRDR